ncbi:TIM-barrel enzyme family protein [Aspergillus luchuensis]|uniref:TIM-barrel enzyme family protein n=1 Tax=Aspergillus kawachii TaxID=1069201 RepID=A0A146F8P9_ASPKA|nr:TIM-barrel enzyme family protein [Aspergillus luchuensis]
MASTALHLAMQIPTGLYKTLLQSLSSRLTFRGTVGAQTSIFQCVKPLRYLFDQDIRVHRIIIQYAKEIPLGDKTEPPRDPMRRLSRSSNMILRAYFLFCPLCYALKLGKAAAFYNDN